MKNKYLVSSSEVNCSYCQTIGIETPAVIYFKSYNGEKYPAICLDCLEAMGLDETASLDDVDAVWASGFEF